MIEIRSFWLDAKAQIFDLIKFWMRIIKGLSQELFSMVVFLRETMEG